MQQLAKPGSADRQMSDTGALNCVGEDWALSALAQQAHPPLVDPDRHGGLQELEVEVVVAELGDEVFSGPVLRWGGEGAKYEGQREKHFEVHFFFFFIIILSDYGLNG